MDRQKASLYDVQNLHRPIKATAWDIKKFLDIQRLCKNKSAILGEPKSDIPMIWQVYDNKNVETSKLRLELSPFWMNISKDFSRSDLVSRPCNHWTMKQSANHRHRVLGNPSEAVLHWDLMKKAESTEHHRHVWSKFNSMKQRTSCKDCWLKAWAFISEDFY